MTTIDKVLHCIEEFERCGGDPKALFKKLESTLTLTEQNQHLELTVQGVKERIAHFYEEERKALSRRDDALDARGKLRSNNTMP